MSQENIEQLTKAGGKDKASTTTATMRPDKSASNETPGTANVIPIQLTGNETTDQVAIKMQQEIAV